MNSKKILGATSASLSAVLMLVCAVNAFALADPTRPSGFVESATSTESTQAPMRLESVLISANRRVAVINGKTCRVGERVDGATVIAIHSDRAVLVRGETRITLPLLNLKVRSDGQ